MTARRTKDRQRAPEIDRSPGRWEVWWRVALIAAAGLICYAGGLGNPFMFDDMGSVVHNASIQGFDLARALSPPAETPVGGRPLVNLSFAINHAVGGTAVVGYHVVNIALHVMCGLLVFGLIRRVVAPAYATGAAFAVALLWTMHPLNSEVVNYLTQRSESLMAFFYLLTIYASVRGHHGPGATRWRAVSVAACAAGMACKESMISAPLMVIVFDRVFRFESLRHCWRARKGFYLALAATWIVLAILVASSPRTSAAGFATTHVSSWSYLLSQSVMIVRYLRLAFWPDALVLYYGWATPATLAEVWPYAALVVTLVAGAVWLLVKKPATGIFAVWVFITLAPTSSIVPIASEVGAERRMYLPMVGLLAVLVVGTVSAGLKPGGSIKGMPGGSIKGMPGGAIKRMPGGSIGVTAGVVVLAAVLGATTMARTREYESPLGMAQTVLTRWPTPSANYMVGTELVSAGRITEAIPHLRAASEQIAPARFNLGKALIETGSPSEGVGILERFVSDEPNLETTRDARLLMARAYTEGGKFPRAIELLQGLLQTASTDAAAHGLLAEALAGDRQPGAAVTHYRAYLAMQPNDAGGWTGLAIALMSTQQVAAAIDAFRQAVNADPANPGFRMNLAKTLIDQGRQTEALEHARAAVSMNPADPAARELLRVAGGGQ